MNYATADPDQPVQEAKEADPARGTGAGAPGSAHGSGGTFTVLFPVLIPIFFPLPFFEVIFLGSFRTMAPLVRSKGCTTLVPPNGGGQLAAPVCGFPDSRGETCRMIRARIIATSSLEDGLSIVPDEKELEDYY